MSWDNNKVSGSMYAESAMGCCLEQNTHLEPMFKITVFSYDINVAFEERWVRCSTSKRLRSDASSRMASSSA